MTARIETPPPVRYARKTTNPKSLVETVNGREIKKYFNGSGRLIYAVGGVGFYHLDEARLYAKGKADDNA